MRFNMPPVDNQIPNVWDPCECIRKNKHRIPFVEEGIAQQHNRTGKAQPPKSRWHHDSFQFLSRVPLNEEAAEEDSIADHTDHFPCIPLNAEKLAVVPNQFA